MVNCRMMSEDWRDLTLWQYQAMLSEWNDRHSTDTDSKPPVDPEKANRLKRFMAAHSVH